MVVSRTRPRRNQFFFREFTLAVAMSSWGFRALKSVAEIWILKWESIMIMIRSMSTERKAAAGAGLPSEGADHCA